VRELAELDLADELRLDPLHVALPDLGQPGNDSERRRVTLERSQLLQEALDLVTAEAGADVADVLELAAFVHREHERAERARAPALPLRVAGDDELLPAVRLDLQPVARAAADGVAGVGPLRHDPFEPLLLRGGEQRVAVVERLR